MVDVFEQVEEELRSDRYKRLARTWLPLVGGILALALVLALAFWGWDSWQSSKADKASVAYDRGMEALQAENLTGADAAFAEAAKVGNGAYKSLALSQQANLAIQRENVTEAIRLFDEAAKASRDPLLGDVASLKAAFLVMDQGPMNAARLADIEGRLTALTDEKRPLRAFAQEALALARLQMGQTAPAREAFVQLQLGQDVPEQVRQRAQTAIDAIDTGIAGNLAAVTAAQAAIPAAPRAPAPAQAAAPAAPPAQ